MQFLLLHKSYLLISEVYSIILPFVMKLRKVTVSVSNYSFTCKTEKNHRVILNKKLEIVVTYKFLT